MNEFCRTRSIGEEGEQQQAVFMVDRVGKKWGIVIVYQADNGKLINQLLQGLYQSANAALVEIELNSDKLLKQLL
jgi:DNA-binding HxlR family transcriptional regulator